MAVPLSEFWGSLSLILQVIVLFLLLFGLTTVKGVSTDKRNLKLHGYLTILALAMQTVLTFLVIIPSATGLLSQASLLLSFMIGAYAFLASVAEILGFAVVWFWVSKPLNDMACLRAKKLMLPLFIIWEACAFAGVFLQIQTLL
jgi:hypothetical protein